ncbi:MAG: hypothetical protein R3B70_05300 [Polyangiaceae bacterium]
MLAPHVLFVPSADDFAPAFEITCDGAAVAAERDPATGLVEVACGADDAEHTLAVSAK